MHRRPHRRPRTLIARRLLWPHGHLARRQNGSAPYAGGRGRGGRVSAALSPLARPWHPRSRPPCASDLGGEIWRGGPRIRPGAIAVENAGEQHVIAVALVRYREGADVHLDDA